MRSEILLRVELFPSIVQKLTRVVLGLKLTYRLLFLLRQLLKIQRLKKRRLLRLVFIVSSYI